MGSTELYVVTGVSGRTGAAAANALLDAGKNIRVVVRDIDKGETWKARGAEVVIADFTDTSALCHALENADGAYLISPPQYAQNDLFIQAEIMAKSIAEVAEKVNLPKLVALSSIGAEQPFGTGWIGMNRILEQSLSKTGLNITFLRAAYFMENWLPMVKIAQTTGEMPSFLTPLNRNIPMIATEDIGNIAAQTLCEDWHGIRIIELEGPKTYSPNNVASHLSQALDKVITATAIPKSDWFQAMSGQGFSPLAIAGFIEMTQGLNSDHIAFTNNVNIEHRKGKIALSKVINIMAL